MTKILIGLKQVVNLLSKYEAFEVLIKDRFPGESFVATVILVDTCWIIVYIVYNAKLWIEINVMPSPIHAISIARNT